MSDVISGRPAEDLERQVRAVLEHAVEAQRRGLKVYESLQNLNEVIGTEYGDRVLYELIQNAHDAHGPGDEGRIAIRLVIRSDNDGELYIANGGSGFRKEDVEAIRNLAISAKEIGEGIGNKGLGFRSIEALTNDVRIFSQKGEEKPDRFDGYCFRFAATHEIESVLQSYGVDVTMRSEVARTIPRYLVPRPLNEQPKEIIFYARRGYATVIVAPLRTAEAVTLAREQVETLTYLDVPFLLFLERIAEVRIDVERPGQRPYRRRLHRRQKSLGVIPRLHGSAIYEVDVGEGRRFLVVRREVDKERVRAAVENSIPSVPQLKRWLDWKGQPEVSVAVGLSTAAVTNGRLYNFLPMGEEAEAPLIGYLDAPFFTDINRRDADLDLPLNETLIEAAAEACAAAALSIVEHGLSITPQAVFDLFAWTGEHAGKLDAALKEIDSALRDAPVIPVIAERGSKEWASLSQVSIWPEGSFAVLKDRDVARHVGARLVSKYLDTRRIERLREVARRTYRSLTPSSGQLADWSEAFARSLQSRKAAARTWSSFYKDLPRVFDASGAVLELLDGKEILLDRSGKLRPAGGHDETARAGVYVRRDMPKGKRKKAGVPLPPATLARRYRFLDERITLKRETLDALIEAGLVREYDPVEALAGLKSALGKKANSKRRQEALLWAFQVWRAASARVDDELQEAELHVPTLSGWQSASRAVFSSSWTPVGRTLENYLVEAAEVSADCRHARDLMLVGQHDWPVSVQDAKRHWARFLDLIGVADGLRPVPARLTRKGSPTSLWDGVLRHGRPAEGLDEGWCTEVARVSFNHPYTEDYRMEGEAWRLPGQIEHETLPESAREALCALIFEHLKSHGTRYFQFKVARFGRYEREWDLRVLPTPLATFLRAKDWIAATTQDGIAFRGPRECWASRVRRGGPPRFIDRVPETVADFSEGGELVELAFGETLGLRDWQSQETAVARLRDLTGVATNLASNERPTARNEYRRAWQDVVESDISLPPDLELIVTRRGQIEVLCGAPEAPADVIVTEDAQRFEVRILSAAGQPVLEVGPTPTDRIASLLEETGSFMPRRLDGIGVQLLVDGEPFVPRSSDALLTSQGLDWLPEVIVIGHEIRGEQLERGIQSSTIDRRMRAIRVRHCEAMTLVVDDEEVSPSEHLEWYAFEHETLPTLILTHSLLLDWMTLAGPLSGGLSRLIDSRLRSPRLLLSQLALYRASDALEAPSDEALARALDCDVQTVHNHRASLRTDLEHILHLLVPVVAYYGDIELSQQLRRDVDRAGARFDVRKWLQLHSNGMEYGPERLIEVCEQAANRTELRQDLELDYERFNRVLLELGEPTLSNEADLRQLYDAHLARLRPEIIERLRRHHAADFQKGNDLTNYVERKSLSFLAFNAEWVLTRETLEMEFVEAHVSALLADTLGEDVSVKLPPLNRLVEANRKVVREVVASALPVLRVWCRQNDVSLPELWTQAEAQATVRYLENKGLLDFEAIKADSIPALCQRASCWPIGMPETLDEKALGLDKEEVEEEEKRRERERQQREIARRSIEFAGNSLDTGDPIFAESLQEIAAAWLSRDETWFERSRQRTRLVEFQNPEQSGGGTGAGGKGSGTRRRDRQLTDAQRQAMGLASEWLAFQFLRRRHSDFVDETCWISENRAQFFGGDEGDDAAGYDFLVKTPQADWLYEVKSSLEDSGEFELTANEHRIASGASKDGRRRYRILYVPYVFSPDKWCVLELPNPMGESTRNRYTMVGRGSVRLRFERR
jgi:hypothetical protein